MVSVVWEFKKEGKTVSADICKTAGKHTEELCNKVVTNQDRVFGEKTEDCNQECVCQKMFSTCHRASGLVTQEGEEDSSHTGFFSYLKLLLKWLFEGDTPLNVIMSTINTILKVLCPKCRVAIKLCQPLLYKLAESIKSMKPESVENLIDETVNWIKKTFAWFMSSININSNTAHNGNQEETKSFSYPMSGEMLRDNVDTVPNKDNFTDPVKGTKHN